jgi:hypothetical protein
MATTITFNGNSPYSLLLTAGGAGGSVAKTRNEVLAACAEGPLKALLTRTGSWTTFNHAGVDSDRIRVRTVVECILETPSVNTQFAWTAAGIQADITGTVQIEIRLPHSSRI